MIQYRFIPQRGINTNSQDIKGIGVLTIYQKEAMFFEGDAGHNSKILGILNNPEVTAITHLGIHLKGYEPCGYEKNGTKKYRYKEWYCPFILDNHPKV